MKFFSTRDHSRIVTASQAIAQGLSDEGGLFVPYNFMLALFQCFHTDNLPYSLP